MQNTSYDYKGCCRLGIQETIYHLICFAQPKINYPSSVVCSHYCRFFAEKNAVKVLLHWNLMFTKSISLLSPHFAGTWLNEERHYYYPGFRQHFRHSWQKRVLEDELPIMNDIEQEERQTYFLRRSRDAGFNGLSLLHRLNPLYQFNILTDLVFDAMHLLPLNIVKNHFTKLLSGEVMDERGLAQQLKQMPWTTDYKSSRLPSDYGCLGYWKAEE